MGSTNQYRAVSSTYRIPNSNVNALLLPSTDSSQFHSACIPKETRERVKSAPPRSKENRPKDYALCNHVNEDRRWTERCSKERNLQKTWDTKYQFMTEFDQKGNPRQKRIPDETNTSQFSSHFPAAISQHIGRRAQSAPAQRMQRLEMTMHRGKRKSKDLIYYD
ncbi:uncharacterized protein LOC135689561 [Rhopilema esculentum]|uniref:uncharacterized protein LOC135689561 n=1 Tax=Rhopilema esculentum TaxID=499914 RepID=UPI0031E2C5D9|eukprot:gene8288-14248_t